MGTDQKVAVITGASQGIGAARLVRAYRDRNYRVVATARSIRPSDDDQVLAVPGDIADRKTAERAISEGVARFGRIDTLINNAGIFIAKPFTEYVGTPRASAISWNVRPSSARTAVRPVRPEIPLTRKWTLHRSAAVYRLQWRDREPTARSSLRTTGGGHHRAPLRTHARNSRRRTRPSSFDRPLQRRRLAAFRARHLRAEQPQIARLRHRMLGHRRRVVGVG